jgi:hypothetical protein
LKPQSKKTSNFSRLSADEREGLKAELLFVRKSIIGRRTRLESYEDPGYKRAKNDTLPQLKINLRAVEKVLIDLGWEKPKTR